MAQTVGHTDRSDRPTSELVKQLADQTTALVRAEVELAKAELSEKGKRVGVGAGMFGGAGVLGFYAFGALTAAAVLALATAVAGWLAALIVAAVYGAVAGVLALTGKKQVQEATPAAPERTVETVKEDVEWVKQSAKSARR
jgi:MFS family permease